MQIAIIGSGNVATVLGSKMREAGHRILQVVSRQETHAARLAEELGCPYAMRWEDLHPEGDLYLVALSDEAVQAAASQLRLPGKLVVHTAGAVAREALAAVSEHHGVLYPLQSLRKEIRPFPAFPLLIDAHLPEDLHPIRTLARSISEQVSEADDRTRLQLHLSAIIVNNFSNYLFVMAEERCRKEGVDFSLLLPLIRETADRLSRYAPGDVQTGPAIRGDLGTITRHLALLSEYPDLAEMYRWFTTRIMRHYGGPEIHPPF